MKKSDIVFIVVIVILVFFLIISVSLERDTSDYKEREKTYYPGDMTSISEDVWVFKSIEAYDRFADAGRIGDKEEWNEMVIEGEMFLVKAGTEARILDVRITRGIYEVRILDGSKKNEKGWVLKSYVK